MLLQLVALVGVLGQDGEGNGLVFIGSPAGQVLHSCDTFSLCALGLC